MIGPHLDPMDLGVYRVCSSKDLLLTRLATLPSKSLKQAVCISKVGVGTHMQRRNLLDCQHLQASAECGLQLIVQANTTQSTCSQDHDHGDGGGGGGGLGGRMEEALLVSQPRALEASTRGRREGREREGREIQKVCTADVLCRL